MARTAAIGLTDIWKDRGITKTTKKSIMSALVFPIATYGSETWAVGNADRSKVQAFEMWCWRKMLRISWKEHKTNEFVRCQVGEYTPLYHKIVHNKLQYFGRISRREGDCLEKIIVQGMMEGQRRRGRQKTRWTDGIKESTGLSVTAAYRTIAQDRHSWNDIIKRVTTSKPWLIGQRRRHSFKCYHLFSHEAQGRNVPNSL